MNKKPSISTVAQGQAGVYRVLCELILRGHRPYSPATDIGVDILLEQGIRIQVKTTMRASVHRRFSEGTFLFSLSAAARIRAGAVISKQARVFSAACDFIVLWAIEAERFWIVPAAVLDNRHTAMITPTKQWRDFDSAQVDTLKAQGMTIAAIAKHLGVAPRTVTRRQTTFQTPRTPYTYLQSYENKWDLITGALSTLSEANAVVGAASQPTRSGVEPLRHSEV